jgi:hypothetical protein
MQPTYLPWSGYFYLASTVDTFVFLDDVQFERRSWQSRNRILSNALAHVLAVPVQQAPQQTLIRNIRIAPDVPWQKKHLRSIQVAYPALWRNAALREPLQEVFERPHNSLADLNIALIGMLFGWLGITCRVQRASELGCAGKRSQHLAEICRAVQADTYHSPIGSRDYLTEDGFEQFSGIDLQYREFQPPPYSQAKTPEFVSHLSVLDVIGQCGVDFAKTYVRKGLHHADPH